MAGKLVPQVRTVLVQRGQGLRDIADEAKRALGQVTELVMACTGVQDSIHSGIYVSKDCKQEIRIELTVDVGLALWKVCLSH